MAEEQKTLLIVEDDPGLQSQLKWVFEGFDIVQVENRRDAIDAIRRHEPQVVLQDLGLPPDAEGVTEGLACVEEMLAIAPYTKIIVVTGHGDKDNALKAIRAGAYDFYQKPVDTDVLQLLVDRAHQLAMLEAENRRLQAADAHSPLDGIVAVSQPMLKVCRMIEKVAPTDVTTLLLGESGTGKELLAKALHGLSPRKDNAFVAINCAAIPENLLESELFGFEKGAFTGATKTTPGKVEVANQGTLFLDEIGDMPLPLQAKLLRFLQERVVERVGGRTEIPVDVRVVCATNQNLKNLIAEGGFREDLYYRICEIEIDIPPLRERENGVLMLARSLLDKYASKHGKSLRGFSDDAQRALVAHAWPGNVRELENKIKGAVIMAEGRQVSADDLGLEDEAGAGQSLNLREVRERAELDALRQSLVKTGGNVSRAAALLGVSRPTLYDLMERHDLQADAFSARNA
ncbi:MAG: PEP-CTERM-box response regulator transcription factor [Pseudomonadota bacterium]